ncbi:MAG: hypothetical protein HY352_01055 [Candidatus Omnitrophica bacterium]|nr:hypothetical protein [Candidatus Omnitrophota bacterium]
MLLPSWLWIGTPVKVVLWLANRLATWTGSWYFWKRFKGRRRLWLWLLALNALSFTALGGVFYWIHVRRMHR